MGPSTQVNPVATRSIIAFEGTIWSMPAVSRSIFTGVVFPPKSIAATKPAPSFISWALASTKDRLWTSTATRITLCNGFMSDKDKLLVFLRHQNNMTSICCRVGLLVKPYHSSPAIIAPNFPDLQPPPATMIITL
jgi:hypothetical protein